MNIAQLIARAWVSPIVDQYARKQSFSPLLFGDDGNAKWDESAHPRVAKGSSEAHGGQFAKKESGGIQMPAKPTNEEANPGDQMGLFGEADRAKKPAFKPMIAGKPKQQALFDTKGDKNQMLMFDDGVTPEDRLLKPEAKPAEKTFEDFQQNPPWGDKPRPANRVVDEFAEGKISEAHALAEIHARIDKYWSPEKGWSKMSSHEKREFDLAKRGLYGMNWARGKNAEIANKIEGAMKSLPKLSDVIEKVNKKNEPEGGWTDADKVPLNQQSATPVKMIPKGWAGDDAEGQAQIRKDAIDYLKAGKLASYTPDEESIQRQIAHHKSLRDKASQSPKDGDVNAEGLVFKNGRWHREEKAFEPIVAQTMTQKAFAKEVKSLNDGPEKDKLLGHVAEHEKLSGAIAKLKSKQPVAKDPEPALEPATEPEKQKSQFDSFDPEKHGGYKALLQLSHDIDSGKLSIDEFKAAHKLYRDNKEAYLADLNKRFDAKKMRTIAGNLGDWGAIRGDNKKGENAESIYSTLTGRAFNIGEGVSNTYSHDELGKGGIKEALLSRIDAHVESQTEESLKAHVEASAEAIKAHEESKAKAEEAKANPKTLDDFNQVLKSKKYLDLTPEQRKTYDELAANESREKRKAAQAQKAEVQQFAGEGKNASFDLSKNYHSKRGQDIFTASPTERTDRDSYDEMNAAAKRLGGWYYKKFGNTPGGFHFPTEEAREKFLALQSGNVDRSEELERMKKERSMSVSERMAAHADRIEERANEVLNQDRKTNTARRADMASGIEGRARNEIAHAKTMRRIAEGLAKGELKHLDGVSQSTHLEELNSVARRANYEYQKAELIVKHGKVENAPFSAREQLDQSFPDSTEAADHAAYPYPKLWASEIRDIAANLKGKRGVKWDRAALEHMAAKASQNEDKDGMVTFDDKSWDSFKVAYDKMRKSGAIDRTDWRTRSLIDRMENVSEPMKRLKAAGIHSEHELRQALREYIPLKQSKQAEDPIKKAERALIGTKHAGFFPTPPSVVDRMLGNAGIESGHDVLEPSAGKGDILDQIKRNHPEAKLSALELNTAFNGVLSAKGHEVENGDFLKHDKTYDRIVMNPPFENGQDIEHVKHAYNLLKPGGRLVAIMSHGGTAKRNEFDSWATGKGAEIEPLDAGSFAGSDAFRQTGVNTKMVTIDKPLESEKFFVYRDPTRTVTRYRFKPLILAQ